jgi:chaperonin GroES
VTPFAIRVRIDKRAVGLRCSGIHLQYAWLESNTEFMREGRFKMNFRPLHDRILIKRVEEKQTVKGGLIIPDTAKEKPHEGEVIAVGSGTRAKDGQVVPLDVKAGDRILFGKYSGAEIKMDNEEYLIVREEEVLGIVESRAATAGGKKK